MTQEDKELLLKDLCARLHYDVMVRRYVYTTPVDSIQSVELLDLGWLEELYAEEAEFKPYLFPLSSMTEEQKQEFLSVAGYEIREEDCGRHTETYYYDMVGHEHNFYPNCDAIDWLNAHHFDYRGLIEKGLALDATEKMVYKFKLIEK